MAQALAAQFGFEPPSCLPSAMSESDSELNIHMSKGLPYMSANAKEKAWFQSLNMVGFLLTVPRLIGLGFALLIYYPMKETYDARMGVLKGVTVDMGTGYLYVALALFSFLTSFLNFFPMIFKSQVMPGNAGNLRSNMIIYKVNVPDGAAEFPAVVLEEEGDVGKYNRANRALHHFSENGLAVALNIFAGGAVFGLPVMCLTAVYVIARIWYQIAYAVGGYGMGCCKHGVPFTIHGAILPPIFEMLV